IGRLLNAARRSVAAQRTDYAAHTEVPAPLRDALQALNAALADHFETLTPAAGPPGALLGFYFEALRFQRAVERLDTHSIFDIERDARPRLDAGTAAGNAAQRSILDDANDPTAPIADAIFSIRNVVPAVFLRPRFAACHSTVLFSATLGPPAYARDLLGLPDDTAWIDLPPAFAAEQLDVRIADRVSTRFAHRQASLDAVVDLVARQFARQPGNYLAFFSSFDYLEQAAARLAQRAPELPQWRQARAMDEPARRDFLQRFASGGRGVGFAVLGGAFAEGIDLPGTRLIGAFVATLGLPPPGPIQTQFRARLDALFGAGHGYADLVPGVQKVVQAAGRVIRGPDDRGTLWLMDERYRHPGIARLLPAWWRIGSAAVG
ncbi:MAG: helicase C-terminal domain-containing protein, partial [Burkholderiaceae bacterium]